ncbi:MAG: metalloregulator ArsR/SmtB family transcription factor [Tepidibacter sp.]|jgi:DNA-binding transcriptional ArsR family regulator|uniref:ArsR/SmtB family transcription factor n=1 Tax=Tepidibacter sp. TaxID=2529387 RepID=UPI0025D17A51|nr:metalloregulator ArsR/SmtB family transcription factor [Tepidibacter sp.]MCT4509542.1 metalloregulator ArsR/SmtB family transcription factor [Tepidibacter sp.]
MGSPNTIKLFRDLSDCFSALADTYRQDIIILLTEKKEMNVSQISEYIELSRPAISHHLKNLKQAGLVNSQKRGTENFYFLTLREPLESMEKLINLVMNECEVR